MTVWLPRDAWDVSGAARRGRKVDPTRRREVIVHHTVTGRQGTCAPALLRRGLYARHTSSWSPCIRPAACG